jgi:hypothetical protein
MFGLFIDVFENGELPKTSLHGSHAILIISKLPGRLDLNYGY